MRLALVKETFLFGFNIRYNIGRETAVLDLEFGRQNHEVRSLVIFFFNGQAMDGRGGKADFLAGLYGG